jgi:hypothetical protein
MEIVPQFRVNGGSDSFGVGGGTKPAPNYSGRRDPQRVGANTLLIVNKLKI